MEWFPPQRLLAHTHWTLTTHILHTHACVLITIIPTTKWQAETTPGLKIPYVIHFPHKWSLFTLEPSLPFGIHNMHQALLKLARVAPPTHVVFDGEMEALFWYLQRFHLNRTATAPTAGRPLTGCTMFWFTNDPDSLQMWASATRWHHGFSEMEPSLSEGAVLTLVNGSLAPLYLD